MEAIVLAAGFGTRLDKGGCCKALLPIANDLVVLDLVLESLLIPDITQIHIVHNGRYARDFRNWLNRVSSRPKYSRLVRLHDNSIEEVRDANGAITDLAWVLNKLEHDRSFILLCADTILSYTVEDLIRSANKENPTITVRDPFLGESLKELGNVEVDKYGNVMNFYEKKIVGEYPVWVGPAYFPHYTRKFLNNYLSSYCDDRDSLGKFITWLILHFRRISSNHMVQAWKTDKASYDIGVRENLLMVKSIFWKKKKVVKA